MRIIAIGVLGVSALLFGCSGGDPGSTAGGSGGADETGGDGGGGGTGGGSAGSGGSKGGSGGSSEKLDAAPASGGKGGSETPPDAASTTTSVDDAGAASPDGPPATSTTGLRKIFDGTTLNGWEQYPANDFAPKDGALVATGVGRGWIATKEDFTHYRLLFSLKPGGTGGHAPTVLIFNTRAPEGQKGLDALGGIQFQPPNGGHWDYRPGKNNAGAGFTKIGGPGPAVNGWYQCEIIANSMTGEAKMACGGKDVLHYKDPTAGKKGPWAIQTHNKGITDAYKDISVEEGITDDKYMTVK
jgi:hypothetical protein